MIDIIITLIDNSNDKERDYEVLDTRTVNGQLYYALVPIYENISDATDTSDINNSYQMLILKQSFDEDGDEIFITVDDDDEYNMIGDMFINQIAI